MGDIQHQINAIVSGNHVLFLLSHLHGRQWWFDTMQLHHHTRTCRAMLTWRYEMTTADVCPALRVKASDPALFERAHALAIGYLESVVDRRVFPDADALAGLAAFRGPLQEDPVDPLEVLEFLDRHGSPATVATAGGRYFGFVTGGSLPAATAARWLESAWDQNAALHVLSPVSSVLESVCEEWLVDLLGLPAETAVGFVGGSSIAILVGLAVGRDAILRRAGWDAASRGLFGAPEMRVVLGERAHSTVYKALAILGLGRDRIESVPVDDQGRMRPEALPELDDRTLLVLQAGEVNSGSFDPFLPICEAARKVGAWIHVDGAFGLWAAASPRFRHLTDGSALADSWSADAHKTLNAPYDNGLVFCRDREALVSAMKMSGSYIVFSEDRDSMGLTPEMSRRARGIEIWACLKSLGRHGLASLVDHLCATASAFGTCLAAEGFSVRNEVVFNQVLVACEDQDLTRATLANLQASGECWCGGTTWRGESAIRISCCSFMTTKEDVDRSVRAFVAARTAARIGRV